MEKRLFLAIALSMLVLIGYYLVFPPPPAKNGSGEAPPPGSAAATITTPVPSSAPSAPAQVTEAARSAPSSPKPEAVAKAKTVRVETPFYIATFDTRGARMVSFTLKNYQVGKDNFDWADLIPFLRQYISKDDFIPGALVELVSKSRSGIQNLSVRFVGEESLSRTFQNLVFHSDQDVITLREGEEQPGKLVLRAVDDKGMSVEKTFLFYADSYQVDYRLAVINRGSTPRLLRVATLFGEGPPGAHTPIGFGTHLGPVWMEDGDVEKEDPDDLGGTLQVRNPQWMGIAETYFLSAASNKGTISHGFFQAKQLQDEDGTWISYFGMELPQATLQPGQMMEGEFSLFLGPKRVEDLEKFGNSLEEAVILPTLADFLKLDLLAWPMLALLRWFNSYVNNYGVAIILLTIVVRVLIFPFTYKSSLAMKRMQKITPRMNALKEKYKNNKERLNKEMMALYSKNKVNPLGCLIPTLIQIPVFLSLYSGLLVAIELRHEPFIFWITDLSAKDGLYVLPVLMGASMLMQQKLMPTSMDPSQARMMMFMPLIFMFFMISFPSGLVLYWFTSNILSIGQQLVINRIKVPEPAH